MAQRRPRQKSEYGLQLAEKQKIRIEYGLREKQFRRYFDEGRESSRIFALLESRLDNVVFRGGLAATRPMARQMVSHGHITVNGRKVTIPSYKVKAADVIAIREGSRDAGLFAEYDIRMKKFEPPTWLLLDKAQRQLTIKGRPDMSIEIQPFNFQTVIEFYSR
jgi:small subunit ribosomal protein S4